MSDRKDGVDINSSQTPLLPKPAQLSTLQPLQQYATSQPIMQTAASVPQASPQQVQGQPGNMTPVMQQAPQNAQSPHNSMQPQSAQFYVQTSMAPGMQAPHAIAPAPGPQTTTTTVSALHQPLQHHLAPQQMNHPGFSPQLQVIQGGIPPGHYVQQVYQNAQGQIIMPGNLTLQTAQGMNNQIQPGGLNSLNQPIQVIKPFPGSINPHMLGGKGVIQAGGQQGGGYNPGQIPTSGGNQAVLISQLGANPTLSVISQPPNILPAQSGPPKPGEMQKVNNMQTFGQLPQGITWAASPAGTLHSPTLLTGQNSPIFIRGGQAGSEGIFIQNPQPQQMTQQNSMVPSIASMSMGTQQAKPRTGMESQPNIQPKIASMRPAILPSINPQLRPGASVSTQTAVGQTITQQMGGVRPQGKGRNKNVMNRAMQQPHHIVQGPQMIQPHGQLGVGGPVALTSIAPPVSGPMTIMSNANPNKPLTTEAMNNMHTQKFYSRPNASMQHNAITLAVGGPNNPNHNIYAKGLAASPQPLATATLPAPMTLAAVNQQQMPILRPTMVQAAQQITTALPTTHGPINHLVQQTTAFQPQVQPVQPQAAQMQIRPNVQIQKSQTPPVPQNKPEPKTPIPQSPRPVPINTQQVKESQTSTDTKPEALADADKSKVLTNGTNPTKPPVSGPPKAMVKPHVLTHVIEGYVIHEASEPFPVSRNSRLNEISKNRHQANTATVAPQVPQADKENVDDEMWKKDANTSPRTDMAKCEVCGKTDLRSKFKKSKRFCSAACTKRFNVGCSKRVGSFSASEEGSPSKRQKDADGCSVSSNDRLEEATAQDAPDLEDEPRVDILKWTVTDVVDFIRNLPGCQDYAGDFELQEIDGQALMLLKADHLMSLMSVKLGPALKICDKIDAMRADKKDP